MADYDGDGRTDVLSGSTCCQGFCFYLFRRKPDGTFGPLERIALDYPEVEFGRWEFPINGLKSRLAVADWNGDGHPDLVVANPLAVAYGPLGGKKKVTMKRLGPKRKKGVNPVGKRFVTTNPVLTDWDGDGLIDLVGGTRIEVVGESSREEDRGVYWWRNIGTKQEPRLGPPQELVLDEEPDYPSGVAVGDWNADGKLDLIVSRVDRNGYTKDWSINHHRIWVYLRK